MESGKITETNNAEVVSRASGCDRCAQLEKEIEENNMAWWRELWLIDAITPEPEAVKGWILAERAEMEREIEKLQTELAQSKRIAVGRRLQHGGR